MSEEAASGDTAATEGSDTAPDAKDDPVAHSPDVHEPLGLAPSDFLRAYASLKGVDLVASLADTALILPALGAAGAADVPLIDEVFLRQMGRVVEHGEGVLVVGPRHPGLAEASFVDRAKLGAYLRTLASAAGSSLEAKVEFVGKRGTDSPGLLESIYRAIFEKEQGMAGIFGMSTGNDEAAMFLGRLTRERRAALVRGERIGVASLTAEQQAPLDRLVYGLAGSTGIHARSAPDGGAVEFAEPTVIAPSGLRTKGFVEMAVQREPVYGSLAEGSREWSTVDEVADRHAELIRSSGETAGYDRERFQLGQHVRYVLKVWLDEEHFVPVPFEETVKDPRGIVVTAREFPPDQRERYEKALRKRLAERGEPDRGAPRANVSDPA